MYTVWANGVKQSIVINDLDDAKEFAHETNMLAFVLDPQHRIVYSVAESEYSPFYSELKMIE